MNYEGFFAELKRRNVVRMAGLYLVGAWLLTQVAITVLMFGAADRLPRTIVILIAIGFPPALIFDWVFEVTPEGLKRDFAFDAEKVRQFPIISVGPYVRVYGVPITPALLRLDPAWDPLRTDPAFRKLYEGKQP